MTDHRAFAGIFSKYGYVCVRKIGEGSYGMAVLVEDGERHQAVCKMVNLGKASKQEVQEAKKEAQLLAKLKNPYIVRYRECFSERSWFGIVMDFCPGGDLEGRIKSNASKKQRLEESDILKWLAQMTIAMRHLHGKNVLHRDLKPANLFLTANEDIAVGDFGISKALPSAKAQAKTQVGTPYYLPPEVIQSQPYSWPADIWSMGCIVYQMCALRVPFDARNLTELSRKICGANAPTLPGEYSGDVRDLCSEMMSRRPNSRPNCDTIIKRPVIQRTVKILLDKKKEPKRGDPVSQAEPKTSAKFEVLDQFRSFDVNGDGCIDRDELRLVLRHLDGEVWTDANVDALLKAADGNNDGRIQFDEFVQWVFGGNGQAPLTKRLEASLELADRALAEEDLLGFQDAIKLCCQAVDLGLLRVAPHQCSSKLCEKLAWLALQAGGIFDAVPDDDLPRLATAYSTAKQLRAVLHGVEQLVAETKRRHIKAIAVAASRTTVKGLCFELADGQRTGNWPGGISDTAMQNVSAKWEQLQPGERITEVSGFSLPGVGASDNKATPSSDLVATLTLATSLGRVFTFGTNMLRCQGTPFHFKAGEGQEIEQVIFSGGCCSRVVTCGFMCSWSMSCANEVRAAFKPAADAVLTTLLRLSWRLGEEQGKHALLQARRLHLQNAFVPHDVKVETTNNCLLKQPPKHWDLTLMQGSGLQAGMLNMNTQPASFDLDSTRLGQMQALLDAAWVPRAEQMDSHRRRPTGVEVVRATMLQNWRTWASFAALQESIQSDMPILADEDDLLGAQTVGHLAELATELDATTNTQWLFHSMSAKAAELVVLQDFDIDRCDSQDGKLYGRGVYFTECSNRVDELSPDCQPDQAGSLHCMLLCRVSMGKVVRDNEIYPDVVRLVSACVGGPYHSVLGDRSARCAEAGAFREFVVYDKDQVYPECLLWYRRQYS